MSETKAAIDKIAGAFEEFKKSNDLRLSEVEKGKGTAELDAKLDKMSDFMDNQSDVKSRLDKIETSTAAGFSDEGEAKGDKVALEFRAAYSSFLHKSCV